MRKRVVVIMFLLVFMSIAFFCLSMVPAETFGYGRTESLPINYSLIPTVNNSLYLDGYSVSSLYDYYKSLFDDIYCSVFGCTYEGDINMDNNNIHNINELNGTGEMVWDGTAWLNENVFIKDIENQTHHLNFDLEEIDQLFSNIFLTQLSIETFSNVTGDYINITTKDPLEPRIIVNLATSTNAQNYRLDYNNYILELTAGTNETPILNRVYMKLSGGIPVWEVSTTKPTVKHALASRIVLGDSGSVPYASALQEDGSNGNLKRIQRRFRKEGILYEGGFGYNGTSTELTVANGSFILGVYDQEVLDTLNTSISFFEVHIDGSYHWHTSFSDITEYSNGATIGNNKYYNVVFGVVPQDGSGNIYAVVQDEPSVEYNSMTDAYADSDNTLAVFPSDDFLRINFMPVARMILNSQSDEAQILPSGEYAIDYRGGVAGGVSSGGGLAEIDPVWTADKPNYVPYSGATQSVNLGNYNITAEKGFFERITTEFIIVGNYSALGFEENGDAVNSNPQTNIYGRTGGIGSYSKWDIKSNGVNLIGKDTTSQIPLFFYNSDKTKSAFISYAPTTDVMTINAVNTVDFLSGSIQTLGKVGIGTAPLSQAVVTIGGEIEAANAVALQCSSSLKPTGNYQLLNVMQFSSGIVETSYDITEFNGVGGSIATAGSFSGSVTRMNAVKGLVNVIRGNVLHGSALRAAANQAPSSGILNNSYGLYLDVQGSGLNSNWQIYNEGGDSHMGGNDDKMRLGDNNEFNISYDGTNPIFEYGTNGTTDVAWFSGNISAIDYFTRTSVYDKTEGSALDFIKDADELKTDGEIDHKKFFGYVQYNATDKSRPVNKEYNVTVCIKPTIEICINKSTFEFDGKYYQNITKEICENKTIEETCGYILAEDGYEKVCINKQVCNNETRTRVIYPYKKTEEGVSLNQEIDLLRQSAYELKQEIETLENKLCMTSLICVAEKGIEYVVNKIIDKREEVILT